jgi:hypothetical protein
MPTTLKSEIEKLAETLAAGVLAAIRGASLEELLGERGTKSVKRGPGRPPKTTRGGGGQPDPLRRPKKGKGGRLARRSPSDIQHVIGLIASELGRHKEGLRSEQLQKALKMEKKEITGPLNQALAEKRISKKGQKRATTYFAR